jgi:hypothetical protein
MTLLFHVARSDEKYLEPIDFEMAENFMLSIEANMVFALGEVSSSKEGALMERLYNTVRQAGPDACLPLAKIMLIHTADAKQEDIAYALEALVKTKRIRKLRVPANPTMPYYGMLSPAKEAPKAEAPEPS